MIARIRKSQLFLVPVLATFLTFSCTVDDDGPKVHPAKVKETIFDAMHEWYYWDHELPVTVDARLLSNEELLEVLRYKTLDRWSYLTTREQFNRAFTGLNIGHGLGFSLSQEGRVYVSFVYSGSPAGEAGVERGWEIVEINGRPVDSYRKGNGYDFNLGPEQVGVSNTFGFALPDGSRTARTIQKTDYQSNSVLYRDVIKTDGSTIGYWVYNGFKAALGVEPTKSLEVEESMAYFGENNIDELIVDLRYNGGGSVDVAEQIMNYLIPSGYSGSLMYTNALNSQKSDLNESKYFEKRGNIEIDRIIFITSRGSASASELLINCLAPYLDVVLIGDNTYGKPVGAFPLSGFYKVLETANVELVPITFAIANANGKAEYFSGLPVDFPVGDDPGRNWGDLEEKRLKAALEYVRTGTVGADSRIFYTAPSWSMIDNFQGLRKEFPVY